MPNKSLLITISIVILAIGISSLASIPQPEFVPGVVVFKVDLEHFVDIGARSESRLGIESVDRVLERIGAIRIERKFPYCLPPKQGGTDLRPIFNVYFSETENVNDIVRELLNTEGVVYAHPWWIDQVFLDHNDPLREGQYNLNLILANEAHDISTGGRDIVIAMNDLGIFLTHEDLAGNIWINLGEDINGDGQITDEDINDADDDSSGFADDFYGWDFRGPDNDPTDLDGHGTITSGIASAVTNNRTGIASVGYNCVLMAVRTGQGNQINFGYEGIEYAARMGANVINCSWGGTQRSDANQEVINYAFENGTVVVAAAGNNGRPTVMYPAGYENAFAVAGTDSLDVKAGFSNYGDWIDVSAPAVEVLSTMLNNEYGRQNGTSMSAPLVSGAAGLLMSHYPDAPPDIIMDFLRIGADDIDELNEGFEGQLGAGRLNILRSLASMEQPLPAINSISLVYEDNNNGKVDPGEQAAFTVTVINRGQSPESLVLRLTTEDRNIEIVSGEVVYPNLDMGERHTNNDDPFIIAIAPNVIPHTSSFTITLTAQPGDITRSQTYEFLIGHPNILLVDDDGGLDFEQWYMQSITELNQGWLRWDCTRQGSPSPEVLADHAMVIWDTGDSYPPLDEFDRRSLQLGVEAGAKILLVGRGIGDDPDNRRMLRNYFGAAHVADSVGANVAVAIPGRPPVSADVLIYLFGVGGSNDGRISPSTMNVVAPGDSLFIYSYEGENTGLGGVYRLDRNSLAKTVYLGFSLTAASNIGTPRTEVMRQIFNWFAPHLRADWPEEVTPRTHLLEPAFPNPFNGLVRLDYSLARRTSYKLTVVDLNGRQVALIDEGEGVEGRHSTLWRASGLSSGVYFARLQVTGEAPIEQKLVLMK